MGAYWFKGDIIEQHSGRNRCEIIVKDDHFVREQAGSKTFMEMNIDHFVLTPGLVMMSRIPSVQAINSIVRKHALGGCTLFIAEYRVMSYMNGRDKFDEILYALSQSPVDYMIAPTIPADVADPKLIRFFSRKGAPFVTIEIESIEQLTNMKWEWLVQAQSHSRIPLTLTIQDDLNTSINYEEAWSKITEQYGIIRLSDLQHGPSITTNNLKDSGIYPRKGTRLPGRLADYNLYFEKRPPSIDESNEIRYHKSVPAVTVNRGQVVQANQQLIEGVRGTHVPVHIHKQFI